MGRPFLTLRGARPVVVYRGLSMAETCDMKGMKYEKGEKP